MEFVALRFWVIVGFIIQLGMHMDTLIEIFKQHNEIEIIDTPLDIYLEIPHLAYLEVKKPNGGKALLFTRPIDSRNGTSFDIPVFMNIFGSFKRLELIATQSPESIATQIKNLLNLAPPKGLLSIFATLKKYASLRFTLPQIVKNAPCQSVRYIGDEVDLYRFPILTTWKRDAAPFITMGQVYTQDLEGKKKNLGLYRLQVHSKNELGLHWQIHKDSAHFFHEYKKHNKKMPVSIGLGGDALYTWCGQAPLPNGIYELMLYGLIKKSRPKVVKCINNELSVPADCDIVIEGFVDTSVLKDEGPFGDHTGFYTPIEPYPVLQVTAITQKQNPIYPASVVGKPPLEDKYMGYLTERVFLPLLQTTAHGLLDYHMPENGVFHNLIFAKIAPQYPGHAKQIMHAFWGVGQMSFVKHALFLGEDAPSFENYQEVLTYVLNRFSTKRILISEGVCDALDHSSPNYAYGGKLGLDVSEELHEAQTFVLCSDDELCENLKSKMPQVQIVRQYGIDAEIPIAIIGIAKQGRVLDHVERLQDMAQNLKIAIFVDAHKNDLNNPYMLVWRIVNNIDAKRDIKILDSQVFVDATDKNKDDGYLRQWPLETDCDMEVIENLIKKGFEIHEGMLKAFHICNSPHT